MTKTGDKLRGRKRPKTVLAKAWETRRKNKQAADRAARKVARSGPESLTNRETTALVRTTRKTRAGSMKHTQQATVRPASTRRFDPKAPMQVDVAAVHRMVAEDAAKAPVHQPSRIEVLTEQMLAAAGTPSADLDRQRPVMLDAVRRLMIDAEIDGEERQREWQTLTTEKNAICEMLADFEVYRRISSKFSPFVVQATAIRAIVRVLNEQGYSPTGASGAALRQSQKG